ncbi:MAG: aminodeoxychorismate/anthranilate synthase component II [Candidatus Heimdallarchaeota archaeon]|nr:aminodeoxychorismate/anthranilate synthase component II [Candidatus Heimdallarchaeota archaeon]
MTKTITEVIEVFMPSTSLYPQVTILDAEDSFTHNIVQSLLKIGAPVRVIKAKAISLEECISLEIQRLILSPGPGIPKNAGIMKEVIKHYSGKIPMLGICLGMQAINEVFGGKTIRSPTPMHGKISIIHHDKKGIFQGIESPTQVARYHSLMTMDIADNFTIKSKVDGVVMAFADSDLKISAVQFHPESFLTLSGQEMMKNFVEDHF